MRGVHEADGEGNVRDGAAPVARVAQVRRGLRKAASFLSMVQHIKARSPLKAIGTALSDPAAVGHMSMPIAVRLRRMAARFAVGAGR